MASYTFALGDTGGLNGVGPVIRRLTDRGHEACVFLNEALAASNQQSLDLPGQAGVLSEEVLENMFDAAELPKPDVFVATASRAGNREKRAIKLAGEQGIPTVSPIENWGPFRSRFSDIGDGEFANDLSYLPDHVLVVDEFAREQALEEGVPGDHLEVMGSPHLETIVAAGKSWTERDTQGIRAKLDVKEGQSLILFASQALAVEMGKESPEYPGYDEFDCLSMICEALSAEQPDAFLVVRLHPFEIRDTFRVPDSLQNLDHVVTQDAITWDLARAADVVVGPVTMLLMEAAAWQKPVVSIQPNAIQADRFIGTRLRIMHTCTNAEDLCVILRNGVPPLTQSTEQLLGAAYGATDRAVNFLEGLAS